MKPGNLLFKVPNPAETRDEGVALAYRVCGALFCLPALTQKSVFEVVCSYLLKCCDCEERKK